MGPDLGGDGRLVELAAARAGPGVGPVLGDDGGEPGQLGDLMPGGLGVIGAGLGWQGSLATGAGRGDVVDDGVDPLGRQAGAVIAAMPGLTAGLAPGGRLGCGLGSVEGIGRRGRGAIGGIALELDGEFFELSLEDGDLSQGQVEFTTQP